jgi:hypothetical protein
MSKASKEKSVFETLSEINVNDKVEKKNNLTYLSWAWAWAEVKKRYPTATYRVYRNPETNRPFDFIEGVGYMVYTYVEIEGEELEMWLPVMDYRNKSMIDNATTFDINKTLMRCLVKNLAMFGLGHYIYAGEDLPEPDNNSLSSTKQAPSKPSRPQLVAGTKKFNDAIEGIKAGKGTVEQLMKKFAISTSDFNLLTKATNG